MAIDLYKGVDMIFDMCCRKNSVSSNISIAIFTSPLSFYLEVALRLRKRRRSTVSASSYPS